MNNEKSVQVNNLYYFNAHTKKDEDVVSTFIARKAILQRIEQEIQENKGNAHPNHLLIIGSRGMGKSTLLRRLEIALRRENLSNGFLPILFPEEQYNIDRLSKFWLNSLDALADNFEEEHNSNETERLDQLIAEFTSLKDETIISEQACSALQSICEKYNRTPVFLIDNLDILFDGISKDQREILSNLINSKKSPIFIAATTHDPINNSEDDEQFYRPFKRIYLERLTQIEMRELLLVLAEKTSKSEIFDDIYRKTAQLDALHSLTGGNPRIAVFMFQLLANGLSDQIFENLNALLDIITPLYKSNFEQLSKQAQIIIDALALNWDPCDLDQLHSITKLENNQLSAQLDRLIKSGWIDRTSRFSEEKNKVVVKVKNYSIRERFFNIWYIMRRASRRQRGDLRSLTCFLETFYSPQHLAAEKIRIINLLSEKLDTDKITYGLALSRAFNREGRSEMEDKIYFAILEQTEGNATEIAKYLNPDSIPTTVYNEFLTAEGKRWVNHIRRLFEINEFEKARQFITSVLQKRPKNGYATRMMADAYFYEERYIDAEKFYEAARKINPKDDLNLIGIAKCKAETGDIAGAETIFKDTAAKSDGEPYFYYTYALFLRTINKADDAVKILKESLVIMPDYKYTKFLLILILVEQSKLKEAEQLASEYLTKHQGESDTIHFLMATAYLENEQYEKSISEFEKVEKEFYEKKSNFSYHYARALEFHGDFDAACVWYKNALLIEPSNSQFMLSLARLLKEHCGKYREAEKLFKRLSEISPKNPEIWIDLGDLYTKRDVYKKAEKAFRIATEVAPDYSKAWAVLGVFYQYLNINLIKSYDCYKKSLELDPDINPTWSALADLCHFELKKYDEVAIAYSKAINADPTDPNLIFKNLLFAFNQRDYIYAEKISIDYDLILNGDILIASLKNALFAIHKQNFGDAITAWQTALTNIDINEPNLEILKYTCAISVRDGFGDRLLSTFRKSQGKHTLRPLYEAVKTLIIGSPEYLNNIAEEIRDSSDSIFKDMLSYVE